ncbi:MAG TPA: M3 family metallopeptidase [Sphingomonas sp.]|jgi:oligopeptidase A|uniref:M3 family metallopeptidase n=1 Tax=Sphingomonas sp. TaxID=28214 RepID=UPI002ED87DBD
MNSLLDTVALPDFPAIRPEQIAPAMDALIARRDAVVAGLVQDRPTAFAEAWLPFERVDTAIDTLWSTVAHLGGVLDTPALRAAHDAAEQRLVESGTAVAQNRALFDVLSDLILTEGFMALSPADRVAVERAIRTFTLSGVALEPEARARFAELKTELAALGNTYSSAVLDATEAWREHITDPALLAGLSPADRDMLAVAARAAGLPDGWLVTLQQPSVIAILTFAENRDLRFRVYEAYGTRASDCGPHAGQFDNGPRIAEILTRRREAARLLGFADPVAWSLATKMAPGGEEVVAFLRDLAQRARPGAEAELAEVRRFAAETLGIAEFQPWDMAFAANALRRAVHAYDEQAVRGYFPVERVLAGWETLLERLFGIRLVQRDDVPLWHADAGYYDVVDADGTVFAGLYVDLHARPAKRGGAWMSVARPRIVEDGATSVPVAYLTCNFAPRGSDTPSLLSHGDVRTLLHETGHCLHHLFTRIDRPSIAGVNGFEWDAIELPSQLMEDFAWDRTVLTAMSGHYETGEPLPAALFERMLAARRFQSGLFLLRQVEFALFDLLLHDGRHGDDPVAVHALVRAEVAVTTPPDWHRFAHAFGHIFSGGYASGYYSYLWAELLAADAFERFREAGLVDRATGDLLRNEILSQGAVRPAIESFRAFRGRDPEPQAMLVRHGLA